MRCHEVRKYLYAFADGELEIKDNLEVLAHLNMCPACAERLDVEQQLKQCLAGLFAAERAPEALTARVWEQVRPARSGRRAGSRSAVRFLGPALAAAALIALVVLVWIEARPGRSTGTSGAVLDNPRYRVAGAELPQCFELGHHKCSAIGSSHHARGLSRNLDEIAAVWSADLHFPVLAPDWRAEKLRFVSACRCGLPGGMVGAHLVYDKYTHVEPVSLYSLQPGGPFDQFEETVVNGKAYLLSRAGETDLIAWQDPLADYVLCARADDEGARELIRQLIDPIRVALADTPPAAAEAFAAVDVFSRPAPNLLTSLASTFALIRYPAPPPGDRSDR